MGGVSEATMPTTLDEIADGIYRISTFVPDVCRDGFGPAVPAGRDPLR
jgi:hypothetical protein